MENLGGTPVFLKLGIYKITRLHNQNGVSLCTEKKQVGDIKRQKAGRETAADC